MGWKECDVISTMKYTPKYHDPIFQSVEEMPSHLIVA